MMKLHRSKLCSLLVAAVMFLSAFLMLPGSAFAEDDQLVTDITVTASGGTLEVAVGDTLQMSAEVLPVDAADKSVTWSVTEGTGMATIDENGLLTALAEGTVPVCATANDGSGVYGEAEVTITPADIPVAGITVSTAGGVLEAAVGGTLQMTAEVLPANATDPSVTWGVTGGTGEAAINQNGLLSGTAEGTVTVRATANDGSGVYGEAEVMVVVTELKPVTGITVEAEGGVLLAAVGDTLQMSAEVLPADATDKSVTWSVTNGTGEAAINGSGLLSGTAAGTVTVRATANDGSGVYGDAEVMVKDSPLFTQGDGTEGDPYVVSMPEQLNDVRNFPNAHFIMTNDIDMTAATSTGGKYYNNGKGWLPISELFGTFNGNGYRIIGLKSNRTDAYAGLFCTVQKGGKVSNLGLEDGSLTGDDAAAIAGINAGTISYCYNNGPVRADHNSAGIAEWNSKEGIISKCSNTGTIYGQLQIGGIAGLNEGVVVDCFNAGDVSHIQNCSNHIGGIVGRLNGRDAFVTNCYNCGQIYPEITGDPGGITGTAWGGEMMNCYYLNTTDRALGSDTSPPMTNVVKVTTEEMQEQETFTGFDFENIWMMPGEGAYCYPILRAYGDGPGHGASEDFAGGTGSTEDPYQISTPEQLNAVRRHLASSFVLNNDIDMSVATAEGGLFYNQGLGWEPIGTASVPFTGNFNGNGHTVSGVHINRSSQHSVGLFGGCSEATVSDLHVSDIQVSGKYYVGGITGKATNTIIDHCTSNGKIAVHISNGSAGGIAGFSYSGNIAFCSNDATVTALNSEAHVGGIIGYNYYDNSISACMNAGDIMITNGFACAAGGICGLSVGTISNCYNTGYIIPKPNSGGIAGYSRNSVDRCYNISSSENRLVGSNIGGLRNSYYTLPEVAYGGWPENVFAKTDEELRQQATYSGFDFDTIWTMEGAGEYLYPELQGVQHMQRPDIEFAGGDGTQDDPYEISTAEQLDQVRKNLDKCFILINDIDLTDATAEGGEFYWGGSGWLPIDTFVGDFNGNGFRIIGLKIDREDEGGLFLEIGKDTGRGLTGHVHDLGIVDATINARGGGIAETNEGVIEDCYFTGSIEGSYVGGITVTNSGSIIGCYNKGNIKSTYSAGGISKYNYGEISYCYNEGQITGNSEAGGIADSNSDDGMIRNCFNVGCISAKHQVGGIVNYNGNEISSCYNVGELDSETEAGGIAWSSYGSIASCYYVDDQASTGAVEGSDEGTFGKTYDELKQQSTFSGFDFNSVWMIGSDPAMPLPQLQSLPYDYVAVTMHFDPQEGTVAPTSKTVATGLRVDTLPTPEERNGYVFSGWWSEPSGGFKYDSSTVNTNTTDFTVYAKWKENAFKIWFDLQDGTIERESKDVTYGEPVGTLPTPTRDGYTFSGWYTGYNGEGTEYTEETVYLTDDDKVLHANWTANTYTLTFDPQEGTVSPESKQVSYDDEVDTLPTPTRPGYDSYGWYTEPNGGGKYYAAYTKYEIDGDTTLYADWAANTYTLAFDPQGGSVSPESKHVIYDDEVDTLPTPTRTGYTFGGWYTGLNGEGTEYTEETVYLTDDDTVLYAKWTVNTYTLAFDPQGGSVSPESKQVSYNDDVDTLPTPTREGYEFWGWYKNNSCTDAWDFSTDKVQNDTVLYAKWIQKPSKPTSLKAVSASYNSIKLSWKAATGAERYVVYRYDRAAKKYVAIANTASTAYTNKGLITGLRYYYKVRAYRMVGEQRVYSGYSSSAFAAPVPAFPEWVRVKSATGTSLKVSWQAVAGAERYVLYRYDRVKKKYVAIANTASTAYTNKGLITGLRYYYKVRAYKMVGEKRLYGDYSIPEYATPVLPAPQIYRLRSISASSVKIYWKTVPEAHGYAVYRYNPNTRKYVCIARTSATSYINKGLKAGKTYYYKLRAYRVVNGKRVYSPYSMSYAAMTH